MIIIITVVVIIIIVIVVYIVNLINIIFLIINTGQGPSDLLISFIGQAAGTSSHVCSFPTSMIPWLTSTASYSADLQSV